VKTATSHQPNLKPFVSHLLILLILFIICIVILFFFFFSHNRSSRLQFLVEDVAEPEPEAEKKDSEHDEVDDLLAMAE